jgi:hypothetical protein
MVPPPNSKPKGDKMSKNSSTTLAAKGHTRRNIERLPLLDEIETWREYVEMADFIEPWRLADGCRRVPRAYVDGDEY